MTNPSRIKLPLVSRKISDRTGLPGPSYRQLYTAVLNGTVPAELGPNGRWTVAEDDLDAIAAAFGLAPKTAVTAVAA